jgi:hypothetical protein
MTGLGGHPLGNQTRGNPIGGNTWGDPYRGTPIWAQKRDTSWGHPLGDTRRGTPRGSVFGKAEESLGEPN